MILSKKRITKALIRLRGCEGCSAPVLLANPRRQVFSSRGPYLIKGLVLICRNIMIIVRKTADVFLS